MKRLTLLTAFCTSAVVFTACDPAPPRVKPTTVAPQPTPAPLEVKPTTVDDTAALNGDKPTTPGETKPGKINPVPVPAPAPRGNPDYAIKAEGKPGFVRSPYTKDDKLIDVRGLPPGTEAQDPYSGRTFLVP